MPALPKSSVADGSSKPADADADNMPAARALARDRRTKRPAGLRGAKHILAFQKAFHAGFANREQSEDHGTVRDRLVAGDANPSPQGRSRVAGNR